MPDLTLENISMPKTNSRYSSKLALKPSIQIKTGFKRLLELKTYIKQVLLSRLDAKYAHIEFKSLKSFF